ncbi:MAG: SymE family type I addiction module toxin [Candidatus Pseudobacter hemicellulosilyticus]|uniref:SymE family type I addiction module toxin n=1 Tax=Candidatus Pseudobacter hemicellulosilyticus TaxID=3121375 RepID=A0AAJ5WQ20_9BACT|nr:MAG: SymE family type I addiction module toxin [Pseudobacter sp.]
MKNTDPLLNNWRLSGSQSTDIASENSSLLEIQLVGKWLDAIGFTAGKPVMILIEPNKITLTIPNVDGEV